VVGIERVARLMGSLTRRMPDDATLELHRVNHEPGLLVRRGGRPWSVLALETHDGRVTAVRLVLNPDKLHHIAGP
jgi:RNA polymerase sigma-70 factor (ECF subfamily)